MQEVISTLRAVEFASLPGGTAVAQGTDLSADTFIGNGVTIYPGVTLGASCAVLDGAVIGRMPISNGSTTRAVQSTFDQVSIGEGSIIGCHAVLYTGTRLGRRVLVGDLASLREGCDVADGVIIGRGVMALYNCVVGRYSRIQDQAHLVGNMLVEEHVFIGMGVNTTNDNDVYLMRFGIGQDPPRGPTIRRLAVVGAGATILPSVEIGEGALVGAGAVVTKNVPPWTIVTGVPATVLRPVPDEWRRQVVERAAEQDRQSGSALDGAHPPPVQRRA